MKTLIILLFLVSCGSNGPVVTKINDFEYIISYSGMYAPFGAIEKLNKKAFEICNNYTIKTALGHDKFGDIKGIHIQCVL